MSLDVKSRFTTATDGLRLHLLDVAPARDHGLLPAVCLCGLTRSARDFLPLAQALAANPDHPRRVVAFDYRGRGLSDHDPDWRHYDLATERDDVFRGLASCGISRAHMVGTSRGGLHVMAMAPEHRAMIASVVFNDIGPELDPAGLVRIKSYVGKLPSAPRTYAEAIKLLKLGAAEHFDGLDAAGWRHFAETTFGEDERDLGLRYDPALSHTLDAFDLSQPLPTMWELFDALAGLPVLTIRGERSDLLSEATFAAMCDRWPGCEGLVVPGQGHAPLLADGPTIARISRFLAGADQASL